MDHDQYVTLQIRKHLIKDAHHMFEKSIDQAFIRKNDKKRRQVSKFKNDKNYDFSIYNLIDIKQAKLDSSNLLAKQLIKINFQTEKNINDDDLRFYKDLQNTQILNKKMINMILKEQNTLRQTKLQQKQNNPFVKEIQSMLFQQTNKIFNEYEKKQYKKYSLTNKKKDFQKLDERIILLSSQVKNLSFRKQFYQDQQTFQSNFIDNVCSEFKTQNIIQYDTKNQMNKFKDLFLSLLPQYLRSSLEINMIRIWKTQFFEQQKRSYIKNKITGKYLYKLESRIDQIKQKYIKFKVLQQYYKEIFSQKSQIREQRQKQAFVRQQIIKKPIYKQKKEKAQYQVNEFNKKRGFNNQKQKKIQKINNPFDLEKYPYPKNSKRIDNFENDFSNHRSSRNIYYKPQQKPQFQIRRIKQKQHQSKIQPVIERLTQKKQSKSSYQKNIKENTSNIEQQKSFYPIKIGNLIIEEKNKIYLQYHVKKLPKQNVLITFLVDRLKYSTNRVVIVSESSQNINSNTSVKNMIKILCYLGGNIIQIKDQKSCLNQKHCTTSTQLMIYKHFFKSLTFPEIINQLNLQTQCKKRYTKSKKQKRNY